MTEWTKEEIKYLRENYEDKSNLELKKVLINRTIRSINVKGNRMGLKKLELAVSIRNRENNPMKNKALKEKMIKTQKENYKQGIQKVWCEGLTKETDERLKRLSDNSKGRIFSEDWINNIKKCHWSNKSKEEKDKIIKKMLKSRNVEEISNKSSIALKKIWLDPNSNYNSNEYRKKRSKASSMERNPMWKGGKSFEPYGFDFNNKLKNLIRKRDNQICMNCGIHREKIKRALDCHHINYDKTCNIIQNLITLCNKCHSMTNINREYWQKFYQDKLSRLYEYKYDSKGNIILEVK